MKKLIIILIAVATAFSCTPADEEVDIVEVVNPNNGTWALGEGQVVFDYHEVHGVDIVSYYNLAGYEMDSDYSIKGDSLYIDINAHIKVEGNYESYRYRTYAVPWKDEKGDVRVAKITELITYEYPDPSRNVEGTYLSTVLCLKVE